MWSVDRDEWEEGDKEKNEKDKDGVHIANT